MSLRDSCAIVAIGDELLAGKHPDLNSAGIARGLSDLDLTTERIFVALDDQAELAALFRELATSYAWIFVTGGLGPTLDDVTRHAAADAAGADLVLNEDERDHLRDLFVSMGREMPSTNERQALFPRGAQVLKNRAGTAPGFMVKMGEAHLFSLPGPPREASVVFEEVALPLLVRLRRTGSGGGGAKALLHLFGLSESVFAEAAGDWMRRPQNPLMGVSVAEGVLTVSIRASADNAERAEAIVAERASLVRERFAEHLFSEGDPDLARILGDELLERQLTITAAESCTGGLFAARLTDRSGISAVFERSFVTYSNAAKQHELGVQPETLAVHGAVSEAVVREMALGAAERSGARLALAVSGVAGPGGGTPEKPVGLVWFATALDGEVLAFSRRFPGRGGELGRGFIRRLAVQAGLHACLLRARSLPKK